MKKQGQLANEIKKLQYQLSYSEHINKQLSQHLSFLCEKTGMPIRKNKLAQNINLINTQNHLQELYYVEPLLMAYQHKTHLLESQLKQLKEDSQALLEFGEQIVSDNSFLRKELESKNQYIVKSEQIGLNVSFIKLDNQNLIEKNLLLQEKNDFLLQKLNQSEENLRKIRKSSALPQANIAQLQKQLREQEQKYRQLELHAIQLQKKFDVGNNQLKNEQAVLKQQERRISELENEVMRLKNDIKISKQQHESFQVAHEGSSSNLQLQIQTLKTQLSSSQRRQNELFNKNMTMQTQLQDKNAKAHNLSLQNTQLQTNNNNILQMLQTYEVKVNAQQKKIKQLENDLKEHSEASLAQRKECEMLEWKLSEKNKAIDKKESQWKKDRERIEKMWEDRLNAAKKTFDQEKDSLYDQIHTLKLDGKGIRK